MSPVAVVTPLGPNPAALTELVWALVRHQSAQIASVHVVLESARAASYFRHEVVDPRAAWDALASKLGGTIPARTDIQTHHARLSSGEIPPDSRVSGIVSAMREPLWQASAQAQADAPSVVFALSGGRWRASTALMTTVFQLRARPTDRLVEVRLSDEVAEGGTGFFFPEQPDTRLQGRGKHAHRSFRPSEIGVILEPVAVPRLQPLLGGQAFETFREALAASQAAIDAQEPPSVEVRLKTGQVLLDGESIGNLGDRDFAMFAVLARAAADGVPEVPSLDEDRLRAYLVPWRQRFLDTGRGTAFTSSKNKVLRALCEGGQVAYDDRNQLSGCWSKLRNRIAKLVADAGPRAQRIIPQPQKHPGKHQGGEVRWSLRLPASCVRVTD